MKKSEIVKKIIRSVCNDMDIPDKFVMLRYLFDRYEQEKSHESWEAMRDDATPV